MNRIAEIKERFESRIKADIPPIPVDERIKAHTAFDENSAADVQYLLSRLEIAEKALERYVNLHKLMYDDAIEGELYEHWWLRQNKHAIEALQQIRS